MTLNKYTKFIVFRDLKPENILLDDNGEDYYFYIVHDFIFNTLDQYFEQCLQLLSVY